MTPRKHWRHSLPPPPPFLLLIGLIWPWRNYAIARRLPKVSQKQKICPARTKFLRPNQLFYLTVSANSFKFQFKFLYFLNYLIKLIPKLIQNHFPFQFSPPPVYFLFSDWPLFLLFWRDPNLNEFFSLFFLFEGVKNYLSFIKIA